MMRLPLFLISETEAPLFPKGILTLDLKLSSDTPQQGCLCCARPSALAAELNRLYIEWAHGRQSFSGLALRLPAHTDATALQTRLTDDVLIMARWEITTWPVSE